MALKPIKTFLFHHLLPSLGVFTISSVVVLSLGILKAVPGTFDIRKSAAETVIKGQGVDIIETKTLAQIQRTALASGLTLSTLFFTLTFVSTHPKKK
jgi:hypothetical protein